MKLLLGTLISLFIVSCSTTSEMHQHQFASHKNHVHGKSCRHTKIEHDDHVDYVHGNEFHKEMNNGEYAIHGMSQDLGRKFASTEHTHKHHKNCGHERVKHGMHWDYIHDGNYHWPHKNHVDQHGDTRDL